MKTVLAAIAMVTLCTGCASPSIWQMRWGDKPHISYNRQSDGTNTGDLFVWNADTNAAWMHKDGNACIHTASYARLTAANTAAGLAIDAMKGKTPGVDANVSQTLSQAAMLLSNQDAQGTYLGVALFNICMMSVNGLLDKAGAEKLISKALETSASLRNPVFNPTGQLTLHPPVGPAQNATAPAAPGAAPAAAPAAAPGAPVVPAEPPAAALKGG
jgi:hypothetical protein